MRTARLATLGFSLLCAAYTATSCSLDTTPPSAPTGVVVTGVTSTSVSLAWNAATDNVGVAEYDVVVDGSQTLSTPSPSATVSGLAAATSYSFTVRARDRAGNASPSSAPVVATTSASDGGTIDEGTADAGTSDAGAADAGAGGDGGRHQDRIRPSTPRRAAAGRSPRTSAARATAPTTTARRTAPAAAETARPAA